MKAYHITHKRSSIADRVPDPTLLDYGEIAVNYAASSETLTIKNSENQIVKFISEDAVNKIIDARLEELSLPIAHALNDLNDRVLELERKIELLG